MRQRRIAIAVIASAMTVAATCVRDDLVECGDGFSCPVGLSCVVDSELSRPTCASADQLAACGDAPTGTRCMLGSATGTCFGGACLVELCGDGIVQGREACDDGNTLGNDGCSANCFSSEQCGDGIVDLAANEQCDDGVRGISGDGCSSQCKVEYLFWRDVTPAQISSRFGFAFVTSPSANVLLFGGAIGSGSNYNASYGETWEWDGSTWAKLAPATSPPSRTLVASAYDPRRDRVVVFGGFDATAKRTDTTWEFDGVRWIEQTPAQRPSPRASASLACSPSRCVLFGGDVQGGSGNAETWTWDGTTWTLLGGANPAGRAGAALAYDEARDAFVLSNGHNNGSPVIDTWELSAGGWQQRSGAQLPSGGGSPIASSYEREEAAVYALPAGTLHKYGATGWGSSSGAGGQTVLAYNEERRRLSATSPTQLATVLELDAGTWTPTTHTRPTTATSMHAAFDAMSGRTILFDRVTGTWSWDGHAWRLLVGPSAETPNVSSAAVVFDEECQDLILHGGLLPSNVSAADTWSFDGTAWTKLAIAGPPRRFLHAMTYDPVRRATLLVGGRSEITSFDPLSDMWQLSGPCTARTWSRVELASPLPARMDAALAFDRLRGVAVLFGGQSSSLTGTALGDTWTWDGAVWTQHAVSPSPPARYDHALAFDPKRRELVLVGGRTNPVTRADDVWRWTGAAWVETPALVSPAPRANAALVPDRTGALVLLGGDTVAGTTPELTRLSYDQALHANERCQLAEADDDRDGFAGCEDPDCRTRCAPACPLADPFASCTGPRCGDGDCSPVEDRGICPSDCP